MTPRNKTAFITGASRGIGSAIFCELQKRNYQILAPSRSEVDLSSEESLLNYLSSIKHKEVDVLINNAAINIPQEIVSVSLEDWAHVSQINIRAALLLTQCFAPGMATRGFGRILNISSILGSVAKYGRVAYSMTKAALDALTRSTALEFGNKGVIANSLAPGYVDTDLTRTNNNTNDIVRIEQSIPLQRMARVEELAKAALFLVSGENTYITGQTIVADGGLTCH